jgi:transposase
VIHLGAAKLIHLGAAKLIQAAGSRGILRTEVPMRPRKDMHDLQELVRLHRLGTPTRDAARALNMSRNTLRLYKERLREAGLLEGAPDGLPSLEQLSEAVPQRVPPQQRSSAADWTVRIAELVAAGHEPGAIFQRLQVEEPGFSASYDAVKRHCRRLREKAPPRAEDVVIRVETPPGEVGQIDFGYVGEVVDPASGEARRAWVFVMVLGHSRHLFARVVFDQSVRTWIDCHVRAFAFFGGAPRVLVPDNLKAAVIRAAFGAENDPEAQRDYRELARFFGFRIEPTPPRAPQKKGKVESAVHYVCRYLATRRADADVDAVNADLARWNTDVAAQRVHGTTRRVPLRVFEEEERAALLRLPAARFEPVTWRRAKVHPDAHVLFERRWYSVPWKHLGQEAWVRATPSEVEVFVDDRKVTAHPRQGPGLRSTLQHHLPEHRRDLAERSPGVWRARAEALGPEVAAWVDEQLGADAAVSALRRVQAVVLFLEDLPTGRADGVCRRARAYGLRRLSELKHVVAARLDLADLPDPVDAPAPGLDGSPKYARAIGELFLRHQGVTHGWN